MKLNLYNFLNSKFILLVVGFMLTGVVGSFLNHKFQKATWERQAHYEIAKGQLGQAQKTIEEILLHANKRFYTMQKVFWSLESVRMGEAKQRWVEYSNIKDDWNIMVDNYRSKIKIFVSPELSYKLLDKDNARNYKDKKSLHAMFVVTHYKLKELLNYNGSDLQDRKNVELEALNSLFELGKRIGNFSENCYKAYLNKYSYFEQKVVGQVLN